MILHVVAPAMSGGLERVVQALAIGQRLRGTDVAIAAVVQEWSAEHPFLPPLKRAGVRVLPLVVGRRAYLRESALVAAVCRELRPTVVHTHGFRADVVDRGAAQRQGIPTVTTAHGFTGGSVRNRFYEALQRRAMRRSDAVIAVSQALAKRLSDGGVRPERLSVIPNAYSRIADPIDRAAARDRLGLPADGFVFGWVGRMTREKGVDVLIEAFALADTRDASLCIVGEGPDGAAARARSVELGVDHRVRWTGRLTEAGRYFSAFDAIVLSSRTEGVPMVVLEAVAAGVPVVATAVGGVPEILSAREALVVPPEAPAALAEAMTAVRRDPSAASSRARCARERLQRDLGEDEWLRRHDEVYDRLRRSVSVREGS